MSSTKLEVNNKIKCTGEWVQKEKRMKKLISFMLLVGSLSMNSFAQGMHGPHTIRILDRDTLLEPGMYSTVLDSDDRILVSEDQSLIVSETRQVGRDGNMDVPYPTVCRYVLYGQIKGSFFNEIYYDVNDIELVYGDKNCKYFIGNVREMISFKPLSYTLLRGDLVKESSK